MNAFEVGQSDAAKIILFYNDTINSIITAEEQLKLRCPIIGERLHEDALSTEINLPCSYHFAVANGKKILGYIGVLELLEAAPEYFPPKTEKNHSDYPRDYKTFYINTLAVRTQKDSEDNLVYDFDVMRLLIDEVVKQAKSVNPGERLFDGIVLNLPENHPVFLSVALTSMGFKAIGVKKKFVNNSIDSWFFELKL